MKPKFFDIENAFEYVSAAPEWTNFAYLCLDTGHIYWVSDSGDSDDDVPDDVEDSDAYVSIPHKNDLELGSRLVHQFVRECAPDLGETVLQMFSRRGPYSRFKELLDSKGLLEAWHKYEEEATVAAIKAWCAENGVEYIEDPPDTVI